MENNIRSEIQESGSNRILELWLVLGYIWYIYRNIQESPAVCVSVCGVSRPRT